MNRFDRLARAPLVHRLTPSPEPQTFRISHPVDVKRLRMMDRHGIPRGEALAEIKRKLVYELAEHLAEKCKVFEFDYDRLMRDPMIHIEITINDRGTYEHLVDSAEMVGRRRGIKEAVEALPYGIADAMGE